MYDCPEVYWLLVYAGVSRVLSSRLVLLLEKARKGLEALTKGDQRKERRKELEWSEGDQMWIGRAVNPDAPDMFSSALRGVSCSSAVLR